MLQAYHGSDGIGPYGDIGTAGYDGDHAVITGAHAITLTNKNIIKGGNGGNGGKTTSRLKDGPDGGLGGYGVLITHDKVTLINETQAEIKAGFSGHGGDVIGGKG